jgi:hypothetical protein
LQAKRNGFTDIENIGIEINSKVAMRANALTTALQIGKIMC